MEQNTPTVGTFRDIRLKSPYGVYLENDKGYKFIGGGSIRVGSDDPE